MNCLNGLFNAIYGEDSLGEALLRAPNGGAVAVWASSSLTPPTTQALVNQELFRLIFSGTYATLGEAVAKAKRVVANRTCVARGSSSATRRCAERCAAADRDRPPRDYLAAAGRAIAAGQQRTLSVAATGTAPISYQWFAGQAGVTTNPIAGARAASYTTPPLTNSASYWVRVSNPYGVADRRRRAVVPTGDHDRGIRGRRLGRRAYRVHAERDRPRRPILWQRQLPSGLVLNPATGDVTGTPNAAGTFAVGVRVTDGVGGSAQQTFAFTVRAGGDALRGEQWHLKSHNLEAGGANVEPAWAFSRGGGVAIGIVDDGVQGTHPDLQPNYHRRCRTISTATIQPGARDRGRLRRDGGVRGHRRGRHRGGRGNGIGVSGVAPSAHSPASVLSASAGDADQAAALTHQLNAVQIENHSWHRFDDAATLVEPGPLAAAALTTAMSSGRNGTGRIFVWSAGDGRAYGDNCNFDGYANSRYGIAVGAVDDTAGTPATASRAPRCSCRRRRAGLGTSQPHDHRSHRRQRRRCRRLHGRVRRHRRQPRRSSAASLR